MAFDLATAWTETTAVVAAVYGVPLDELRAPSRGRGPKPRVELVAPRKVALYVTLCLSSVDYATLGRHIGLSRDTVATHAAEMRLKADANRDEQNLDSLQDLVKTRLWLRDEVALRGQRIDALRRARLQQELLAAAAMVTAAAQRLSDDPSDAPSDDVIIPLRQAVAPREAA